MKKHLGKGLTMVAFALGTATAVTMTAQGLSGENSSRPDPNAEIATELRRALDEEQLSPDARALIQSKLDGLVTEHATRVAAPRPTKPANPGPTPFIAPTVAAIEPRIKEPSNPPYHGGVAIANNEFVGTVLGLPTFVFAANMVANPQQGLLTVMVMDKEGELSRSYSVQPGRESGKLEIVSFDTTSVTAEGADGSKWRLNLESEALVELPE